MKLKTEKYGNDSLSIEHKEKIKLISRKSTDLLISSINNINNNNNDDNNNNNNTVSKIQFFWIGLLNEKAFYFSYFILFLFQLLSFMRLYWENPRTLELGKVTMSK